jgi:hypothetical protein
MRDLCISAEGGDDHVDHEEEEEEKEEELAGLMPSATISIITVSISITHHASFFTDIIIFITFVILNISIIHDPAAI